MLIADPNLDQRSDWQLVNTPDVNPIPSDSFVGVHLDDGTYRISNAASRFGGALLAQKRQMPMITGSTMDKVTYVGMDMEFYIEDGDFAWLWAHETDLKICVETAPNASTKIPNIADFSGQVNMGRGGMVQIDAPGQAKWVDTGIKLPPSPGWNLLQWRYKIDFAAATFSVLSVNGQEIDPGMQNCPFLASNWRKVAALQLQNELSKPGVLNIKYHRIHLLYSPDPIPTGQIETFPPNQLAEDDWGSNPDGGGDFFGHGDWFED